MRPPYPDRPGHVSRRDPLPVGGESSHSGLVGVFCVDLDVEWTVEVADDDGAAVAVEEGVGFRVAGD